MTTLSAIDQELQQIADRLETKQSDINSICDEIRLQTELEKQLNYKKAYLTLMKEPAQTLATFQREIDRLDSKIAQIEEELANV